MLRVELVVKKRINFNWSEWFEGLTIRHTDQDETILCGNVVDQAALYGLLAKLRNLGLPLLSVKSVEMDVKQEGNRAIEGWRDREHE
jgi:hypothetical protein